MAWVVPPLQTCFVTLSETFTAIFFGIGDLQEFKHHQETLFWAQDCLRWCLTAQVETGPLPCRCRTLLYYLHSIVEIIYFFALAHHSIHIVHKLVMEPYRKQPWNRYSGKAPHGLNKSTFENICRLFHSKAFRDSLLLVAFVSVMS